MNKRSVDDNFARQACVYGASCYMKDPEHLYKFQHPGEDTTLVMRAPDGSAAAWQPSGTEVALRGGPPGATQQNPAGLYGFDTSMATFPPGMENSGEREPTPPPPVARLPGYLEESPRGLKETDKLVYGAGAKRDAGGVVGLGLPKLNAQQALVVQRAKKYAMEVSIKMVLMKQTLAHQQQQTKYLQRQQAVAVMSRIYVGCINYDTREEEIKKAFVTFGPIRSITMSWDSMTGKHKGFAFVEFEQPEAAQLALDQMNGILVLGRNIKVGWPSQMPQAQACIDEIQRESRNFNRIYVAGIHKDLGDDDIRSVFSAFGQIKTCELASAGIPGRHKGYGYIEYETLQSAQEAISSMNLFDLGGQLLRVGRAVTPPGDRNLGAGGVPQAMPSASAVAAAAVTAKIQAMDAVATNLGVDASKLALPLVKPALPDPNLTTAVNPTADWRDRPIRKCGLPRDELGRPIKIMPGQGVQMGPKRPPGDRTPSPKRSRSPRRSRDRDSRGRSRKDSRSRSRSKDRKRSKSKDRSSRPPPPLYESFTAPSTRKTSETASPPKEANIPPPTVVAPVKLAAPMQPGAEVQASTKPGMEGVQETAGKIAVERKLQDEGEQVYNTLKQQEEMRISGKSARQMVMQKLMGARGEVRGKEDSVVLLLKNMVGPDEVDEELHEEIQQECGKYGKVENVVIYQEKQDDSEDAEVHVKIFVEFHESIEAKKAKNGLDGRFFGGRTVSALIYDQEMYDQQDFSA